jgi:ATP-dependent DNA helicase RecQ
VNPIVRHFLPSVIRGVYRFDDSFSEVNDEKDFQQFVEGKLKFLPSNIVADVCQAAKFSQDFRSAQHQRTLPAELLESMQTVAQRAKAFFRLHRYFADALDGDRLATDVELKEAQNYLEIQFVKKILAPLLNAEGLRVIRPQRSVGPYFVDFALEGGTKLALEVDGFGKFKTRNDLDDFTKRQNYITAQGWRVIRFTYAQVMETTGVTLREMHNLLKADTQFRRFLTVQWHTAFFRELQPPEASRSAIDLVNNFYRIQDWLVEFALAEKSSGGPLLLKDNFGFEFPFVAAAISALYEFLDAVASIVDVGFDLPLVEVGCASQTGDWALRMHRLVSIKNADVSQVCVVDGAAVKERAGAVPVPSREAGAVKFRRDLSLNEIHERLQYFTRNVFGYSKGTLPFQTKILQRVFNGDNVLGISATGSGKSFCFWLPALLKPGLTLVIAPLRSLMRDQRLTLLNYGIASAEFINSDVDPFNQRRILEEAKFGYVRLLYISPERLRIKKFLAELARLQEFVPINFLAVDEAHCISEWGHDFRPSYLKLPFLRKTLSEDNSGFQLIALTATAGQQVQQDMLGILQLRAGEDGDVVQERVADRERFSYQIVSVKDGASKSKTYRDILTKQLPKALRQPSLPALVALSNGRQEKALGIVFCIYADPHGKHSIWDGTAHYLFETMRILEPAKVFESQRAGIDKFNLNAFSEGKVRAFSSKPPTLCPRCQSYAYTSKPRGNADTDDEEVVVDDEERSLNDTAGVKVCYHCKKEFDADDALKLPKWQNWVKANQVDFKNSGFDILIATKGFGMGIDKSSVRFIVHTSLSSGLESWYQEVGRAGRDNERAHIVLLTDPPNEPCRKELGGMEIKKPKCSYKGGCPHGKEGLCDYGKQHMFITSSYPGAESDAVSALRVLDKLIVAREESEGGAVVVNSSNKYLSHDELAIYRLTVLGLVEDYVVTYTPSPRFDLEFTAPELPDRAGAVYRLEKKMQERLAEHLSYFSNRRGRTITQELTRCRQEYQPLETFTAKLRNFEAYSRFTEMFDEAKLAFYRSIYEHLLLLLDHTYKDVVKMRYDMLWNLLVVVTTPKCRRLQILPHFQDSLEESYRCGACDVCAPNLEFPEIRNAPQARASNAEKELLLEKMLSADSFDVKKLLQLADDFSDYPTAKYRQARSILEGNANNLPALFLAREFSPPEELEGNAKRLLRTANQRPVPLLEVQEIFKTSPRKLKPNLIEALNEADTACDSVAGWKFLVEEAGKPENHGNEQIAMMRECLEFFVAVEELFPDNTQSLRRKARDLEEIVLCLK